ncbi:MAG: hypothetical protein JWN23_1059 [Rhodocyclales bacterium]|nr:hypothetical protein [Rhodocyclales bacterium]
MNRFILIAATALLAAPAFGASVNIFGRVDIGGLPRPPVLIAPTPIIVERGPAVVEREPVYLHVPEDHRRHWNRHCREYNACGERVFFVQDDWYQREYVPRHEHEHEHDRDRHDQGRGRGHDDHDRGRHDNR